MTVIAVLVLVVLVVVAVLIVIVMMAVVVMHFVVRVIIVGLSRKDKKQQLVTLGIESNERVFHYVWVPL